MKEKNTLKKFISFRYTDLTAVCEYLEEMEAQGWQLVSMGMLSEFRKCEPRKVRYAAELLESASAISNSISDKSQDYIDMCEQAGWEFICNIGKMFIFRTESETAPEIVTDSAEKLADIKKALLKTNFITWLILPVIMIFNFVMQVRANGSIAVLASQYIALATMLLYLLFFLTVILQIAGFIRWYVKAKSAVASGLQIPYVGLKQLRRRKLETYIPLAIIGIILLAASISGIIQGDIIMGAMALIITIFLIAIIALSHLIQKLRVPAIGVIIISVVISIAMMSLITYGLVFTILGVDREQDKIKTDPIFNKAGTLMLNEDSMPISLNDLDIVDDRQEEVNNYVYGSKTILAAKYSYNSELAVMSDNPQGIYYDVYYSNYEFLKKMYIDSLIREAQIVDDLKQEQFGANEAHKLSNADGLSDLMIVYDDYIVVYHYYHDESKPLINSAAKAFQNVLDLS